MRVQAVVRVLPPPQAIEHPPALSVHRRTVAILSCHPATQRGRLPVWYEGQSVATPNERRNILRNGSLVLFQPFTVSY